jgi:peptide deformylase
MTWNDFFADLDSRHQKGLEILPFPHPILTQAAVPINDATQPELEVLAKKMFEILYQHKGVGLAAPQIGLPLRIFVVNATVAVREGSHEIDFNPEKELVFVNPSIAPKVKGGEVKGVAELEGCLSLPGIILPVHRPRSVVYETSTLTGKAKGEYSGNTARVVQHEYDHLDGRLITDYTPPEAQEDINGVLHYLQTQFEWLQKIEHLPSLEAINEQIEAFKSLAG